MALETPPGQSPVMVDFPSDAQSHPPDVRHSRPPYLPFRRISLPAAPSLIHRQSIVSTLSVDSLPEEGPPHSPLAMPSLMRAVNARAPRHRPSSVEVGRRNGKRRETRIFDEQREVKRRKIIDEFYETERTYVDGLELIYSQFLTPIIASLDTPQPLLGRDELTSVFSNFIDIWNLHRSFFSSLTSFLQSASSSSESLTRGTPPLSPVLLSHFPYLSLYTPFITSFPHMLSSYTDMLTKNQAFANFIATQEADPRCGKLKLRDWLLTIVQRCPRYLLLLKDLIGCTDRDDPEYNSLTAVHTLVSKITVSLNTSLHTHAQTLSLLALQRSTTNLPFQLITPGRTFLKRAPLLQLEGSLAKEREFLLFSDCIVWLANADKSDAEIKWEPTPAPEICARAQPGRRPPMVRSRSKSEAELSRLVSSSERPSASKRRESMMRLRLGNPSKRKSRAVASSGTDERWIYKGHLDLVDIEVILPPAREDGEEKRLEILSPLTSFAVYADSEEERDEWATGIRTAKASLLVSLNVMHPNSTLTSSQSTQHIRQQLQALPYSPDEHGDKPKRGKVEHFVPAIWIPDGKTDSCMRCGRTFGWRRRRHHCRLCGRCVCASCSGKTFFILDSTSTKSSHKSARSCDACYETVFPIIDTLPSHSSTTATISHLTLSGLKSMPSLLLNEGELQRPPSALMSINLDSPRRALSRLDDPSPVRNQREGSEHDQVPALRVRQASRPRSFHQIVEDFQSRGDYSPISGSPTTSRFTATTRMEESSFMINERVEEEGEGETESGDIVDSPGPSTSMSLPPSPRKEDTARRHKRFSLPAVAIQTTPVTAMPKHLGEGRSRRISLVLGRSLHAGGPSQASGDFGSAFKGGVAVGKLNELLGRQE